MADTEYWRGIAHFALLAMAQTAWIATALAAVVMGGVAAFIGSDIAYVLWAVAVAALIVSALLVKVSSSAAVLLATLVGAGAWAGINASEWLAHTNVSGYATGLNAFSAAAAGIASAASAGLLVLRPPGRDR